MYIIAATLKIYSYKVSYLVFLYIYNNYRMIFIYEVVVQIQIDLNICVEKKTH